MRLIINDTAQDASRCTADYVISIINNKKEAGGHCAIAFPSGQTPLGVYQMLVDAHKAGAVDFEHVVAFALDEYVGIPRDHPNSQHTYMWKNFFSQVNVKRENIYFLDGNATDHQAECARYEDAIAAVGGLDFAFFSTGPDGHVARNEPGSSMGSLTRPKTLAVDTIEQIADRWGVPAPEVTVRGPRQIAWLSA